MVQVAGGRWRVHVYVLGQRASGTFRTQREAKSWAAEREAALHAQARAGADGRAGVGKTLRDALRRYADEVSPGKRGEAKELVRLRAFEGAAHATLPVGKALRDVTVADLAAWRDARLRVNARASVARDLTLLSAVLETARREWGWLEVNVVRDVRKPGNVDHRTVIIQRHQVRAVLRALGHAPGRPVRSVSQAAAGAFVVALRTGMRAGELCGLEWRHVHADYCVLPITKNGKPRHVPLLPGARRALERLRGVDDVRVFGLAPQTLDALFRRARARAGLDGFTFHDARHTAATWMVTTRGVQLLDLCRMFGWSNTKQALTYYNPTASDIARRVGGG